MKNQESVFIHGTEVVLEFDKVVHPEEPTLKMNIQYYPKEKMYCGDNTCCDGSTSLEEAKENALEILQSYYDGSFWGNTFEPDERNRYELM